VTRGRGKEVKVKSGKWKVERSPPAPFWAAAFFTAFILLLPGRVQAITAQEIMERIDDLWRGESSFAEMTMEIETENWKRSLKIKAWSLGKDYSLLGITYPPRERGTATLKAGKEIWNYLPRVNRVIKIPSSMMMAGWMGSHFTNDDLVKESRMSEDYNIEVTFEGKKDGIEIYELTLTPKPEAPVVWGRIDYIVQSEDLIPLSAEYFDEDGNLSRSMALSDIMEMGGRKIPTLMTLVPADKPNEKTVIRYTDMEFDLDLNEDFFSIRNLSRRDLLQ
jgi:outer membrane lipoprotein-sorting protein